MICCVGFCLEVTLCNCDGVPPIQISLVRVVFNIPDQMNWVGGTGLFTSDVYRRYVTSLN